MHMSFTSLRNAPEMIQVLPLGRAALCPALDSDLDVSQSMKTAPWACRASRLLGNLRATSVLALGDAFSNPSGGDDRGKSDRVLERLGQLNTRLRIESRCDDSAGGFESVISALEQRPRSRFDALILFVRLKAVLSASEADALRSRAARALAAASVIAKRCFLVAAIDSEATWEISNEEGRLYDQENSASAILQRACSQAQACLLALETDDDEASIPNRLMPAGNFSVDGFNPGLDSPEMWTARLLQQPALAELIFN